MLKLNVKRLKELLNKFDDDVEIMIRNSNNPCGNIAELYQVEKSSYGFFGDSIPCIILNSANSKEMETDQEENIIDYLEVRE